MHDDYRIKHLELTQEVIARMAGNSFLIKGWAVTIASALFGFASKEYRQTFATIALLPSLVFWGLDAYYLRQERLYRALYDRVRKASDEKIHEPENRFSLSPSAIPDATQEPVQCWGQTLLANTIWPVYLPLLMMAIGIIVLTL